MRCSVPAGIWGQWKLSTPASRLPRLCKHNKVSLCHTGDLPQLLGWQHLLISWMSEWTWSLLNFLQAAALALLHDEETVGLPAGLGLHREALHHVPRHAQVLHLDTGKLARLLYNGMALTHRYTALWQWPLTTISWYAHTALALPPTSTLSTVIPQGSQAVRNVFITVLAISSLNKYKIFNV